MSYNLEDLLKHTRPQVGCLVWTRARTSAGYGQKSVGGRVQYAHRLMAEIVYGPAPDPRMDVLHSCDVPACIRPEHLRWGTRKENVRDMYARRRNNDVGMPGEKHPAHKVTEDDVRSIRARYAVGQSLTTIAADYPISYQQVRNIARRESWKVVA